MFQQYRWVVGSLALVVGLVLATTGLAQDARGHAARPTTDGGMMHGGMRHGGPEARLHGKGAMHRRGHGHHLARMREVLQLTEEQVGQIRDIMFGTRKQAIMRRAELQVAELDLRDALTRPEVDQAAVDKHILHIGEVRQQLLRQRVGMMTQVHALLTPEQRTKARSFLLNSPHHPRFDATDDNDDDDDDDN